MAAVPRARPHRGVKDDEVVAHYARAGAASPDRPARRRSSAATTVHPTSAGRTRPRLTRTRKPRRRRPRGPAVAVPLPRCGSPAGGKSRRPCAAAGRAKRKPDRCPHDRRLRGVVPIQGLASDERRGAPETRPERRFASVNRDASFHRLSGSSPWAPHLADVENAAQRGRYLTGRALGVASSAKGEEGHAALQSYH